MNQLSPEDEEALKKIFDDLKDKLIALKKLAIENDFLDKEDISNMVDKINQSTTTTKVEYETVSAKSPEMVETVNDKLNAKALINKALNKLQEINNSLNDPNMARNTNLLSYTTEYQRLEAFFQNPTIVPSEYATIKTNYDATDALKNIVSN